MPNWVYNRVKIHGNEELKRKFVKDFLEKGFETVIPVPEALKKYDTETSDHWKFVEKVTKGMIQIRPHDEEEKKYLLEELYKYEPESEEEKIMKNEIIECLKMGYYSWYEFAMRNWGTDRNPWDIEYIEDRNTLTFVTAWTIPFSFLEALSKKLGFTIEGESFCIEDPFFVRYHIEKGQTVMIEDLTEEFVKEIEREDTCSIGTEPENLEKT